MSTIQIVQYVLPIAIIALVLGFRLRSMGKVRPLDLKRLWVLPAVLLGIAVLVIAGHPPGALGYAICFAALVVGALIGWHRGKLMRINHDPETGKLTQVASPAAMVLLVTIILIRYAARAYFGGNPTAGNEEQTLLLTDALLLFGVGLIGMTRVEMAIRARRILAEATAAAK